MIRIILAFGANFISSWIRIRIRIWNADSDPGDKFNADPCGSGSETLKGRGDYCKYSPSARSDKDPRAVIRNG